jgi:hypothetical protein
MMKKAKDLQASPLQTNQRKLYENLRQIQNASEKKSGKSKKINSRAFLGHNSTTGY